MRFKTIFTIIAFWVVPVGFAQKSTGLTYTLHCPFKQRWVLVILEVKFVTKSFLPENQDTL